MTAIEEGTWEHCNDYLNRARSMYTVISSSIYAISAPDSNGIQKWRVDITFEYSNKLNNHKGE